MGEVSSGPGTVKSPWEAETAVVGEMPAAEPRGLMLGTTGWKRYLLPSFSDCLFIFIIVWLFVASQSGWQRLIEDGDTGWHIRTGQIILATGSVPRTDPFSFSKPGAPWYAWEWLSDVGLALLHQALGLKGVTLAAGVLIALFGTLLIRFMIWRGANLLLALFVGLLGLGAASVHYLARPHLFTMVLLVITLWMLERDRQQPSPAVWLLIPLTALWANLHAGFPALLVCIALLSAGSAMETWVGGVTGAGRWWSAKRYALLGLGCAAASLVNPYGIELHRHILSYLRSDWIKDVVGEFQSPSFRAENVLQFEALLFLGLMAATLLMMRRRFVEASWIVVWAYLALSSSRHIPIFVIVAAPVIAVEATRLWDQWSGQADARSVRAILSRVAADLRPGFRRTSLWPVFAVLFLLASGGWMNWPTDFPADSFPTAMINRHQERIAHARIFTEDQWADYLLYRFYPIQRVFFDGRSDFYGPEIGNQYLALLNGRKNWKQILEKNRFDLVLSPTEWALTSLLKQSPDWRVIDMDKQAFLFARRVGNVAGGREAGLRFLPRSGKKKVEAGLMKQVFAAESTRGDYAR